MSDKYTDVAAASGGGVGIWGHVSHAEAVDDLRRHAERQLADARSILADIEAGRVRVFHQLGPWAARNRREIVAESAPVGGVEHG